MAGETAQDAGSKEPDEGAAQSGNRGGLVPEEPADEKDSAAGPAGGQATGQEEEAVKIETPAPADSKAVAEAALKKVFEEGKIAGLQEAILAIMEKNGPITDQMRRDVTENVYHDSLIAWVKSFR